jgi:hypothetical protein
MLLVNVGTWILKSLGRLNVRIHDHNVLILSCSGKNSVKGEKVILIDERPFANNNEILVIEIQEL